MDMVSVTFSTLAVICAPGFVLSVLTGIGIGWSLVASIPVSFGFYGLCAWLAGAIGVDYQAVLAPGLIVAALIAGLWGLGIHWSGLRHSWSTLRGQAQGSNTSELLQRLWVPQVIIPAVGVCAGALTLITRSLRHLSATPGGINNIFQGWDVQWHANVVRWIVEEGIASPTKMGLLQFQESHDHLYYPSAWHAGAAVLVEVAGVSPIAATNLMGVILPAVGFPLSAAVIAWKILGNRGLTAQIAAGIAGLMVFASPVLHWIGHYVGAWPYVAAMSLVGPVIGLFLRLPYTPATAFVAVVAMAGVVQLHPAPITVVVLVVALWWLCYQLWRPVLPGWKGRLRDLAWLAGTGIVAVAILIPQLFSGSSATEEVASFTAFEDVSRAESWVQAITMDTRHVDEFGQISVNWILAAAVVGAVAALVWKANLWAVLFTGLSVALTAHSFRPFETAAGDLLTVITSLHYNTGHRLIMPVALFVSAFAAVGLAVVVRLITLGPWHQVAAFSAPAAVIVATFAAGGLWWAYSQQTKAGEEWAIASARVDQRMVSDVDLRAWDWLAQQPHAFDGYITGEPADGLGWMYAYNGLPSLFRHYYWPETEPSSNTDLLFWRPNLLGQGDHRNPMAENAVDAAARDQNVRFFYTSPPNFWHFQHPSWPLLEGMWQAPGVTLVYADGDSKIWAVNAAFTDAEITAMRESAPTALPPAFSEEYAAQLGENQRYHRPTERFEQRPDNLLLLDDTTSGGILSEEALQRDLGVQTPASK